MGSFLFKPPQQLYMLSGNGVILIYSVFQISVVGHRELQMCESQGKKLTQIDHNPLLLLLSVTKGLFGE